MFLGATCVAPAVVACQTSFGISIHMLWSVSLRMTGDRTEAEDVSQDVFVALLVKPPGDGAVRSPRGYLVYRVLTFAERRRRAGGRRREREIAAARNLVVSESDPAIDPQDLQAALDELPEKLKTVVQLRFLAGLTYREISSAVAKHSPRRCWPLNDIPLIVIGVVSMI